jgi:hypothetical protein
MNPSSQLRTVLAAIALLSVASLATAADTPTSSSRAVPAGQAVKGSLSPELVKPSIERTTAARTELRQVPMTKDEKAIFDIQESGRTQVAELQKQIEALSDGPARRALETKTLQVKRDTEVLVLRTIAGQALQRGDLAAAHAANETIEMILHPKAPQSTLAQRPAPGSASDR